MDSCTDIEMTSAEKDPLEPLANKGEEVKAEEVSSALDDKQEVEESDSVRFFPPVYLQRYCRVRETLKDLLQTPKYKEMFPDTGKTVMEVGCAEFGMMVHLKSLLDVGKIIFLDLDEEVMQDKLHFLRPLPAEFLQRITRPKALEVEAYAGCVTKPDADVYQRNPDIWAVIGIELIEHLHSDVLRGFEETVFGVISPHIVIVTTPNSDFNEVFNLAPGKFRHWDHKFEWSREEFQLWCEKIVKEFKSYIYRIEGIGEGPEETRHLGCVSQMAVFEKKSAPAAQDSTLYWRIKNNSYKLLQRVEFPNYVETRSDEEIILCETHYFLATYVFNRSMLNHYYETDTKDVKIPLIRLMGVGELDKICNSDTNLLRDVLEKNGYKTVCAEDSDTPDVVVNVDEYVRANLEKNDSDSDQDEYDMMSELKLCEETDDANASHEKPTEEDYWE